MLNAPWIFTDKVYTWINILKNKKWFLWLNILKRWKNDSFELIFWKDERMMPLN